MIKLYFMFIFVLSSLWAQSEEKVILFQEWEIVNFSMAETPGTLTKEEMQLLVKRNVSLNKKSVLVPYLQLLGKKPEELYKKYRDVSYEFKNISFTEIKHEFGINPKKLNLTVQSKSMSISVFDHDKNQILSLLSNGEKTWIIFEDSSTLFELKKVK